MSKDTIVNVKLLNVLSNSTSSIIQVGDRDHSYLYNQSMSIERNRSVYGADEPLFEHYSLFTRPVVELESLLPQGKTEHAYMAQLAPLPNQLHSIEVDTIKVISNSQAGNIQLGNGRRLVAENRQKAIIQYVLPNKRDANQ